MKRIVTAVALALSSCATAPAMADIGYVVDDARAMGYYMCGEVSKMARDMYNATNILSYEDALTLADEVEAQGEYILRAIDIVYHGGFSTGSGASIAVRVDCKRHVDRQIAGLLS